MRFRTARREGFALAVALAAIVIIGSLIGIAYFASTQQYRIGRNTVLQARALTAAENGLYSTVSSTGWDAGWNTPAGPGVLSRTVSTLSDGSLDSVIVTALPNGTYSIVSIGQSGPRAGAQGRRRIGALVSLSIPTINLLGALTTRGSLKLGGSSQISGTDYTVPLWGCPSTSAVLPGVALPDSTQISYSGCKNCISGSPAINQSSAAGADSTYNQFGDLNWAQLVAAATVSLGSGGTFNGIAPQDTTVGGTVVCNKHPASNWGDPLRLLASTPGVYPCANYFPVIYSNGNLHITGGSGQGILLVNGDLIIDGGFQFFGPVIIQGSFTTQGTGGHINGGVMASNVNLDQSVVLGNAVINYSSCAITRALNASATPMFAKGRSWTELY
jgi:hypothetical protein